MAAVAVTVKAAAATSTAAIAAMDTIATASATASAATAIAAMMVPTTAIATTPSLPWCLPAGRHQTQQTVALRPAAGCRELEAACARQFASPLREQAAGTILEET